MKKMVLTVIFFLVISSMPLSVFSKTNEPLVFENNDYHMQVTCDSGNNISLDVKNDINDKEDYEKICRNKYKNIKNISIYDISLIDHNGEETEPETEAKVDIKFKNRKFKNTKKIKVIHFKEHATKTTPEEIKNIKTDDNKISFKTDSFSVYAVIELKDTDDENDPFGLDGETYGLILYKEKTNTLDEMSVAVMAEVTRDKRLKGKSVISKPDPSKDENLVFIAKKSTVSFWTFHSKGGNVYEITTQIDDSLKYVRINGKEVTLVDVPDAKCQITLQRGTDQFANKLRLVNNGYALNLKGGSAANGFCGSNSSTGQDSNEWFNLADFSILNDDDYVSYSAAKVSISDEEYVTNGKQVIIYTRKWNASKKQYDTYAIDHDGGLIECYESGSNIQWIDTKMDTLLWNFTEYYYEGTNEPNHYYELQNNYSGKYLAPQTHNNQILSNEKIGLTINGRRYGSYFSKILAWDDPKYDYAGLKIDNKKLTTVPMSKADEFYFAVYEPKGDGLTTIKTIDNNDYGIKMKMIKYTGEEYGYHGGSSKNRNMQQTEILGSDDEVWEPLVTNDLKENGYPDALKTGRSLSALFESGREVNHIFAKSTYDETGYYEFNCTENFAALGDDNNFKVYNQLGTFDYTTRSSQHGQFMPFNDIEGTSITKYNTNQTNELNETLPDSNPRKDEKMYGITKANAKYFFGMEMSASFMQNENGSDIFGNDLIFEFAGDDDMWLYVDGELVLDLGTIHSAYVGKINYKTGEVVMTRGKTKVTTTLRAIFKNHYLEKNPDSTNEEVENYLDTIFDGNKFKNYTAHDMKMFYMERGAGSSNLHMKFNLSPVDDGEVQIAKRISGTNKQDYLSTKFPFKVCYFDESTNEWTYLKQEADEKHGHKIVYNGTSTPVETSNDGETFYLRAGEIASVFLPSDSIKYKVVECDINTNIYDTVSVNNAVITGQSSGSNKSDFETEAAVVENRKKAVYTNHVSPDALRSLTIIKRLYDTHGNELDASNDPQGFKFRVYIGEDDNHQPQYYRFGEYFVKSPDDCYCKFDSESQKFVSIGKTRYSDLTQTELDTVTFTTSPNGTIDKIPAQYKVEIRELLVGIKFRIDEREDDIPKGYKLLEYNRVNGSYIVEEGDDVNCGTIRDNAEPIVEVKNEKGWGLTVEKKWSDDDFMNSHAPIYIGLYKNNSLVTGSIREITDNRKTVYYYLDSEIDDYSARELVLNNPIVQDGTVISYDGAAMQIGQNDTITVHGYPVAENDKDFLYTVDYNKGSVLNNTRTDVISNSRPGLSIIKTDWEGTPLANAVFTLKDANGDNVSLDKYVSNGNGLVTIAYLPNGVYTLTEIKAPDGHQIMAEPVTITINENGITTSQNDAVENLGTQIKIKNKRTIVNILKKDKNTAEPLQFAHFSIHKQIEGSSGPMKDFRALSGYEDLVTTDSGLITDFASGLKPGTYYLEETIPPINHKKAPDIKFVISDEGIVSLPDNEEMIDITDIDNRKVITINVFDEPLNRIKIKKINSETQDCISETEFKMYRANDFDEANKTPLNSHAPLLSGMTSNDGILDFGFIESGTYFLTESGPPEGYKPIDPIKLIVSDNSVVSSFGDISNITDDIWMITIPNEPDTKTLTIKNIVKGNLGDIIKNFEYTVRFTGLAKNTTYGHMISDENGNASINFSLKKDEEWEINNLPSTTKIIITESASNHISALKVSQLGSVVFEKENNNKEETLSTSEISLINNTIVEFTNTRTLEPITGHDTGICIVCFLILVTAICFLFVKRRERCL